MQIKERWAYKGGRTECFIAEFNALKNEKYPHLYYYDINSSYPNSMRGYMPGKHELTIECKPTV